ncbi:MAG: hypothetical protein Q7T55_23900 [Solirubrobacteraceae bacterium]|nr:hypothetical protein [Solirubrobacteraceae bacterium]
MIRLDHTDPPVPPHPGDPNDPNDPNRAPPMPPAPAPDVVPVQDPQLPEQPEPIKDPPSHQPPIATRCWRSRRPARPMRTEVWQRPRALAMQPVCRRNDHATQ